MTKNQQPAWLPIDKLPLLSESITGLQYDTEAIYPLFLQAQKTPWVLDDATVGRAIRLYTERLDILALNEEQLLRWTEDTLTLQQQEEIAKLLTTTAKTKELVTQLLEIASKIKENTIDSILARNDGELALDVLTGKLKLPK